MIIMLGVMVIVTAIIIVMTGMTIAAAIVIVVMSVFAMSRAGSPFGFFGVGISICCLYQLADGGGPITV